MHRTAEIWKRTKREKWCSNLRTILVNFSLCQSKPNQIKWKN